jgi:MFS family permease
MEHNISFSRAGIRDLLRTPINRSLKVGILSSFILRMAGGATAIMLVKYLNFTVAAAHGTTHIHPGIVALLSAIFYLTELVMSPVMGALSDRWGRKPFLVLGPIFGALAVQIHPLTTVILVIALARLFEGLATACNVPSTLGFLSDATGGNPALRGRVMGLYEVASLVGLVTGPAVGGLLWEGLNLGSVTLPGLEVNGLRVVSLIYLLAVLLIYLFVDETTPGLARRRAAPPAAEPELAALVAAAPDGPGTVVAQRVIMGGGGASAPTVGEELRARVRGYRELLRLPRLINFIPAWLTVNAVLGLWFTHVSALLTRPVHDPSQLFDGGFSATDVAKLFAVFGVIFTLGILFWSLFYSRIRKTTMMLSAIGGTVGVCVFGFLLNNQVLPSEAGMWAMAIPLFLSLFLMSGFTPVALAYLADISEERAEDRGMVMGLYSVLFGVGQLGGALIGTPFIQAYNFNGLLLATGVLALFGIAVILHLRRITGD